MAVTTAQLIKKRFPFEILGHAKVAAGVKLLGGTYCFVTAAGYATDVVNSGANKFLGIVKETVDNTSGAAGDKQVEFFTDGLFALPLAGAAQANAALVDVYASDNYTLTLTSANMSKVGQIEFYNSGTEIEVRIRRAA